MPLHVLILLTETMGVDPRKNVEGTLPSLVCPPLALEVVPLKSSKRFWRSAVSSPSGVEIGLFGCILALKSDVWWQQF